jgi:ubiquinone/menaquinone biosynthesis C-methylase UbiE
MGKDQSNMPALRFRWLTPFYDGLIRWLLPEKKFKMALLRSANLKPGEQVLDFGCGTGTLLRMAAEVQPGGLFTGLDTDPQVLALAGQKLRWDVNGGLVKLMHYDGADTPFPDVTFDKILCSLVFCNQTPERKKLSIRELHRILKTDGELHIAEWGKPAVFRVRPGFRLLQAVGGFKTTRDLAAGKLPAYLEEEGFRLVKNEQLTNTWFGTLYLYECRQEFPADFR